VFLGIGVANVLVGFGSSAWILAVTQHRRGAHGEAETEQPSPDPLQATRPV
jgi:hypothetical protein